MPPRRREDDRIDPDSKRRHAHQQRLLIEFLTIELGLGFLAASHYGTNEAEIVVRTVRRFKRRVEDDEQRRRIEQRLADLEKQIVS